MNLIEAINEMKNGKVVKGSNLLLYRIKDVTIEYFYEPYWTKTGLSILDLSELTFEITKLPNETLSDKIVISEKIRVDMPCNSYATISEDTEVIRTGDVKEFINNVRIAFNNDIYINTNGNSYNHIRNILNEHAGDRFK